MTLRYRLWNTDERDWVKMSNGVPRSLNSRSKAMIKRKAMKNKAQIIIKPVDEFGKVVYIEAKKRKGGSRLIVPDVREVTLQGGGGEYQIEAMTTIQLTNRNRSSQAKFLRTLIKLEVGESFLFPATSNHRNIVAACPILIGKRFIVRIEPGSKEFRVGRVQ